MYLIGWLISSSLRFFLNFALFFHLGCISLSRCLLHYKGQCLRYLPGWGYPLCCVVLWHCLWGRGPRGNNSCCSVLSPLSITFPATHKWMGPFWCWFPHGWVYVSSRTPWVSPMNSPVRFQVSPATTTPKCVYSRRFWGLSFLYWNPVLHSLSQSPVVPPSLSAFKCGTTWSTSHSVAMDYNCPGFRSPFLLPVWMTVSSLTLWL